MLYSLVVSLFLSTGVVHVEVVNSHLTKDHCMVEAGKLVSILEDEVAETKARYAMGVKEVGTIKADIHCNKMSGDINLDRQKIVDYNNRTYN